MDLDIIAWSYGTVKYGDIFPGSFTRTHTINPYQKTHTLCGKLIPSEEDVFELSASGGKRCKRCAKAELLILREEVILPT